MNIRSVFIKTLFLSGIVFSLTACFKLPPIKDTASSLNNLNINLTNIPSGNFLRSDGQTITLSSFYMFTTEVTYQSWTNVYQWSLTNGYIFTDFATDGRGDIGRSPIDNLGQHPVTDIEWYDCLLWANALSELMGRTPCYYTDPGHTVVYRSGRNDLMNTYVNWNADGFRLPTEAEWEYACRAGNTNIYFWGTGEPDPATSYAWYTANSGEATHPVASLLPNSWGLYDIVGNVNEWIWDWHTSTYLTSVLTNPLGPASGSTKVIRGGSYNEDPITLESGNRNNFAPSDDERQLGFRLVTLQQ